MIAYIKGLLVQSTPLFVVIDVHGIGHKVFIPPSLLSKLPQLHQEVLLQTSFVVRELSQTLYGFLTIQDRDLFEALMGVSGIGPKLALSIIGHLPGQELYQAITNSRILVLSKVPGIGKKTAERLIIEMRDKIGNYISVDQNEFVAHSYSDPMTQKINDAMSALINLGYNQVTAQKAIKKTLKDMPETANLSELITAALKFI